MTRRIPIALLPLAALLVSCEAQKSSNPLSPSIAGPIPGVNISQVKLLEPGQGFKYKENQQPIRLLVENASTNGVRPLTYTFEVASDAAFTTKVYARSGVPPGDGGRTSVQIDKLELGRGYYWRARAEDGANIGEFAATNFEVLPRASINPPVALSPINNERASARRPTLRVRNAQGNAAVGALSYQFMIAKDQAFTQISATGTVNEGGGETSWVSDRDLDFNLTHYWRVRATDGETTTDWIQTQVFLSPLAPPPAPPAPPGPPGPPPTGSCAGNHGPTIVACISAKYAAWRRPVGSLGERQANMMFLRDRIIEAGQCGGMNLGYNLKRGGPERSIDVLAWKRPDGNMGVDIGFDYDNIGSELKLVWAEVDLFAVFDAYGSVSCAGV